MPLRVHVSIRGRQHAFRGWLSRVSTPVAVVEEGVERDPRLF
ncbi:MAG: hypothetical protein WB801_03680 [Candidatus Dormiibacterota bacterium]